MHSLAQILSSPEVGLYSAFACEEENKSLTGISSPRLEQVSAQLKDTKFAQEGVMLEKYALSPRATASRLQLDFANVDGSYSGAHRFFKMLDENPLRAWYGESHVFKAAERGAIGKLLVSDELFR